MWPFQHDLEEVYVGAGAWRHSLGSNSDGVFESTVSLNPCLEFLQHEKRARTRKKVRVGPGLARCVLLPALGERLNTSELQNYADQWALDTHGELAKSWQCRISQLAPDQDLLFCALSVPHALYSLCKVLVPELIDMSTGLQKTPQAWLVCADALRVQTAYLEFGRFVSIQSWAQDPMLGHARFVARHVELKQLSKTQHAAPCWVSIDGARRACATSLN